MAKKRYIGIISLVLAVLLTLSACSGSKGDILKRDVQETTDKMRTYYEIFPYSFADSNGDGIGDLQGIIDKLDYIADMNFDGIWLTPVHQSTTYHKYDVVDYKSIDSQFGTLEDYDRLVAACHDKGMTILLDLVFNHTSVESEWFQRCFAANLRGETDNQYYNYYNFKELESSDQLEPGWEFYQGRWAYECQFWSGMPDLNLQNVLDEPDGYLANDLKEVMRFWLVDHDVDGFRLDAVTSYFTADEERNLAFLTWLNDTAKEIKPDCYIVGEGSWGNVGENQRYQASGVDSFFSFQHSQGGGNISYSVRLEKAAYLYKIDEENVKYVGDGIPATFIANHDVGRAYGSTQAANDLNNLKMAYGLMAMSYGTIYHYYGDEAGMVVLNRSGSDSYIDEDKRQPMPWGDSYQCKPVTGSTKGEDSAKYPLGTVKEQLEQEDSVISYITKANAIRRAFPQIARSQGQNVYVNDDRTVCIVSKGNEGDRIYIVMNASHTYSRTYDLSQLGNVELAATLSTGEIPSVKGTTLTIPAQSFAILTEVEE